MIEFKLYRKGDKGYGPTDEGHYYLPVQYHNENAKGRDDKKSKWILSESDQYCVFKYADEKKWFVAEKGIVGLNITETKKLEILGTDGERVSFFPLPTNEVESWHGYPLKMNSIDDSLDDFFISLRNNGIINRATCIRLVRKQI